MVRASTAALVSKILLPRDVRHRGGRAVSVLRTAAIALRRRRGNSVPPRPHRPHGQLQFLQSADDRTMRAVTGRLYAPKNRAPLALPPGYQPTILPQLVSRL